MSVTAYAAALAIMVGLAFYAGERNYQLTSTSLMVATGALAAWLAASVWYFG